MALNIFFFSVQRNPDKPWYYVNQLLVQVSDKATNLSNNTENVESAKCW